MSFYRMFRVKTGVRRQPPFASENWFFR